MRQLLLIFLMLSGICAFSQSDSASQVLEQPRGHSIITLHSETIERMPVTNLMELLQWAFAFAGNDRAGVHQYSFLTDDFVALNPNSINLSQIETITFFPAGTLATRGNQVLQGTFVIRLKKAANRLFLISKNGITANHIGLSYMANENIRQSKPELFSYTEANWQYAGKKFQSNNAVSWLQNNAGKLERASSHSTESFQIFNKRYRISSFQSYQINQSMDLRAGLTLTNQPLRLRQQYANNDGQLASFTDYPDEVLQISGHVGLHYASKRLHNALTAEMVQRTVEYERMSKETRAFGGTTETINNKDVKSKQFLVTNTTQWALLEKHGFRLGADLVLRYRWENENSQWYALSRQSGMPQSEMRDATRSSLRQATASTLFHFRVKEWLRVSTGVSLENLKISKPIGIGRLPNSHSVLYEALAEFNLHTLVKTPKVSNMKLTSHYLEYSTTPSTYDGLDRYNYFYSSTPFLFSQAVPTYGAASRWLHALTISLGEHWQARVMRKDDRMPLQGWIPTYIGGSYYSQPVLMNVTQSGWGVELQGLLINQRLLRWQWQLSAFSEKNTIRNSDVPLVEDVFPRKTQWYSSLHTDVRFQGFFLQATALFAWNGKQQVYRQNEANVNQQQLRFLAAGYRFSFSRSVLAALECNVQTRNLAWGGPQYPYTGRYLGIGLKADFRLKAPHMPPVN